MNLEDSQIMQAVQNGQFQLFDTLVLRYRSALLRVAESKLGDLQLAEDIVQECFLAVFASRATYLPELPFRSWVWTILLNLCRKQTQKLSRNRTLQTIQSSTLNEPGSAETGLTHLLEKEQSQLLHAYLSELPEPQADALRLRFFGGLKFQEIAEAMECSLRGAKNRVKVGLIKLSARIQQEDESDPLPQSPSSIANSPTSGDNA